MSMDERVKAVLSNLGRATLRGIRKCPKCSMYNGTRGICCKNKKCNYVFKDIGEKRKLSSEAVKLLTGTTTQVYSVRVKDRGPDHRGFVQLPFIQTNLNTMDPTISLIHQTAALCFVDTCQRLFDTSILKCHESDQVPTASVCFHIQAAMKCANEANPLMLRNSILSSLNVSNEIKQELWLLATETAGPLVQRVSKNIMAVKCQTSPKHPLGYLHFSIFTSKTKDKVEHKYICSCLDTKESKSISNQSKVQNCISREDLSNSSKKCLHYYACICAFASDSSLTEEFASFVNLEQPLVITPNLNSSGMMSDDVHDDVNDTLVSMFSTDLVSNNTDCNIEVLTDQGLLDVSQMVVSDLENNHEASEMHGMEINSDRGITIIRGLENEILSELPVSFNEPLSTELVKIIPLKMHSTDAIKTYPSKKQKISIKREENEIIVPDNLDSVKNFLKSKKYTRKIDTPLEDTNISVSFFEWLASITEAINQTMHFQFNGNPEPLKFNVPQIFFDCFRDRISSGGIKKRLPNFTKAVIRRDKPPIGIFTKYTWHITNILHLKQIFECPLMSLDITRSFIENKDGTYDVYNRVKDDPESYKDGFVPIKPLELKTYLKVGNTSADQNEPTPFIIEWIPDVYPVSKVGEMMLKFKFGHCKGLINKKPKKITISTNQKF